MIEFGKTLREAREAAGLSISQIAERTHMMSVMVEDLENERFSRVVAPIYGRGFVKLYCETVGLDPKPMVAEFMEIYTGNREPTIRERVVSAPREPDAAPAQSTAAEPQIPQPSPAETVAPDTPVQPAATQDDLFNPQPLQDTTAAAPIQPLRPAPPLVPPSSADKAVETPRFTHYSNPVSDKFEALSEMKVLILRWTLLVGLGALVLWGLVAGIRALYRATAPSKGPERLPEAVATPPAAPTETPSSAESRGAPRTPIAIGPLYID